VYINHDPRPAPRVRRMVEAAVKLPEPELYPQHKWLIALAVMLGTVLEILDSSIVNVSLPHMQGSFSASVDEVTWVVTSYLVANGIMIPLTGWISARFGRKRYFMFSVSTFVIASAMCGAARTLDQMVIFRLLQGFAGAAMAPSSQAIMMETFPPQEQQLAMATWSLGLMVAPVAGPTVGGWITDNWSWRWNFYINVPIGLIATLMVYTFLHDPPYLKVQRGLKVDYLGIACLTTGLGLMQLVVDRGQRADWFSTPWVTYATAGCVIALLIFTWQELHFPDPVVDLRMFKYPMFTVTVVLTVMLSFAQYGASLLNPIFLQEYMGYTAWRAGLALAPRAFGTVFSLILVGQLARYGFNTRRFIGPAFVITAVALWMMSHWNAQISMWHVTGYSPGDRHWPGFSAALRDFPGGGCARAHGLRVELVQHDAQHRRRHRNFVSNLAVHRSTATSSVAPGGALLDFRRLADEPAVAAAAGRANVRDQAAADRP
jgi:DHA2 family multidrug resistance protein